MHHLAGPGLTFKLHRMWEELGAVQGREMVYDEAFAQVEDAEGRAFTVYVDPDRLEAHVKELSPADAVVIEAYADGVRRFARFEFFSLLAAKPCADLVISAADGHVTIFGMLDGKYTSVGHVAFSKRCPSLR